MVTEEMKKMSIKDRIILMEELWDTLCDEEHEIKSPDWHKEVLDERRELIKTGKAKFIFN
ncbi:MAG: addiction module protein [Candidatus Anammoxibacter sp.]